MAFFNSAVGVLQTLVIALGAGLGIWGVINLLEGYGNDNPGAKKAALSSILKGINKDCRKCFLTFAAVFLIYNCFNNSARAAS